VLDGDELVLLLPRLDEGHVKGDFQFLRDHGPAPCCPPGRVRVRGEPYNAQVSSIVHCSGCWCLRARSITCSTFAAATSRV